MPDNIYKATTFTRGCMISGHPRTTVNTKLWHVQGLKIITEAHIVLPFITRGLMVPLFWLEITGNHIPVPQSSLRRRLIAGYLHHSHQDNPALVAIGCFDTECAPEMLYSCEYPAQKACQVQ